MSSNQSVCPFDILDIQGRIFSHFYVFLSILFTLIIKYRVTIKYLKQWYLRSILAIACGSLATYSIYAPNLGLEYAVWHPIWHSCIFTTAFMATSMRHSFDKEILDNPDYTRAASDSI